MYSSRGSNPYGQQSYTSQSSYGQNPTSGYTGSSTAGQDNGSQLGMGSRHPSILGAHESEIGRHPSTYPSASAQYAAQYSSLYASGSLGSGQQVSALSAKGSGSAGLEGRNNYSGRTDSPKYPSADFGSSTHGYSHKTEHVMPDKIADYAAIDRRQFADRQGTYGGRDLPVEAGGRYADPAGYSLQQKSEMYDRLDQASLLRQEQMLKSQSLQPAHEGARQADYLAVRSGTYRHPTQELVSYGGRVDADPRVPSAANSSYAGQSAPSILGAAPQRNVEDLMYGQTASNPGYGVSLPPGRDYGMGKGLHGTSLEPDFPGSISSRGGRSRFDDLKDERYIHELDLREEELRRERLRERERERDREEREREREREKERERERRRLLDLRDKERDRDRDRERKRATESRRERTPPRASTDRRGSSLSKDAKSVRLDSPRRAHRIHSPVKRREYVCKVYTSSLIDVERDYMSLDKRYPRLYVSPDFSKVVVNWPRENLNIPMHTPVSFEHDFIEEGGSVEKDLSTNQIVKDSTDSKHRSIVWNAKMILMSGLSRSAIEDLSSEKLSDDRIPHICNILRFAVLKKDRSMMAIGGPWDAIDGADPAVDDSSLIQTILRYAKDLTHLDLQNCRHWNRFLEIHYDRVGKDGLFSHREVTVLFVPDLSDCLPSLNSWREQWLAHRKVIAEREKQLSLGKEKSRDKKDAVKETSSPKDDKAEKTGKKKVIVGKGKTARTDEKVVDKDSKTSAKNIEKNDEEKNIEKNDEKKNIEKVDEEKNIEKIDEEKNIEKEVEVGNSSVPASVKPVKKKIVRRIVKQKGSNKKVGGDNNGSNNEKAVEVAVQTPEASGQQETPSADVATAKTFNRKKAAKKVLETDVAVKEMDTEISMKNDKQPESAEDKSEVKSDATGVSAGPGKRTVKRKIIKRVPIKKVTGGEANNKKSDKKAGTEMEDVKMTNEGKGIENVIDAKANQEKASEGDTATLSSNPGNKLDVTEKEKHDEKKVSETTKTVSPKANNDDSKKSKEREKSKDGKDRKDKDGKDKERSKSSKDAERKKSEEPPRPGFILKVKSNRDARLRSLSLSLESLLGYSDNDFEESTFELSVFAESFCEMLQYQMASRVLTFLQKLRIKFITKRNRRKRQREQTVEKQTKEKTAAKRLKSDESLTEGKSTKSEVKDKPHSNVEKSTAKEDNVVHETEKLEEEDEEDQKMKVEGEEETSEEEDPEEDPEEEDPEEDSEEDEEMEDRSPQQESSKKNNEEKKTEVEQKSDGKPATGKTAGQKTEDGGVGQKSDGKHASGKNAEQKTEDGVEQKSDGKHASGKTAEQKTEDGEKKSQKDLEAGKKEATAELSKKTSSASKDAPVDKELLQAFRFFDRNCVGYLRVEDMRLILHNLGKFLPHRDVKELVQSALLESNTGRDDRILYEKLVRMSVEM